MKKNIMILSAPLLLVAANFWVNTIYFYSVPKIEGGSQALSAYTGKKMMVVTLPIVQTASADSMLYSLDTIATHRSAQLQVIAVPSYEDGYTPAQKAQLEQWYRSKLSNIVVITDGLYTRKSSGNQQHPLFMWLTTLAENEVFNQDVEGPEHKFVTDNTGHLNGVLKPQTRMWGNAVQRSLETE